MSNDNPSADADSRSDPHSKVSASDRIGSRSGEPPASRSYLSLIPWRNFRRVLFLIMALAAVLALKRSGGGLFRGVVDSVAPMSSSARPPTPATTSAPRVRATTVHIQSGSFVR
jgi:hypothetical protein